MCRDVYERDVRMLMKGLTVVQKVPFTSVRYSARTYAPNAFCKLHKYNWLYTDLSQACRTNLRQRYGYVGS